MFKKLFTFSFIILTFVLFNLSIWGKEVLNNDLKENVTKKEAGSKDKNSKKLKDKNTKRENTGSKKENKDKKKEKIKQENQKKKENKHDKAKKKNNKSSKAVKKVKESSILHFFKGLRPIKNTRIAPTFMGYNGLRRVSVAEIGRARYLFLGMNGAYARSTDVFYQGDYNTYSRLDLFLGYNLNRYFQFFGNYRISNNSNTESHPNLIQVLGDFSLGTKGVYRADDYLSFGGDLILDFHNKINGQGPRLNSTNIILKALATLDLPRTSYRIPARVHFNLGFVFENTDNLTDDILSPVQQFALDIAKQNRLLIGVGLEAPLPYLTPFMEYNIEIPLGVSTQDLLDSPAISPGDTVAVNQYSPQYLSFGFRVTALRDLSFDLGVDLGINPIIGVTGVKATLPYQILFGISWMYNTVKPKPKIIEKIKTVKKIIKLKPDKGQISGTILDLAKKRPIEGALIYVDGSGVPPVATSKDGRFLTQPLKPGKYTIRVTKEGYEPGSAVVEVKKNEISKTEILIKEKQKFGGLSGFVIDLASEKPIKAAIHIVGQETDITINTDEKGKFDRRLPVGSYRISVTAKGYLAKRKDIKITDRSNVVIDFSLRKKKRRKLVEVKDNRIVLKRKIHFIRGSAIISMDSYYILDSIIDIIANNPRIKKIRVEGHTDNTGSYERNKKLSRERAEAVVKYFISQGLPKEMFEAVGYGPDKPIAPNTTRKGREQNRRVEFVIIE